MRKKIAFLVLKRATEVMKIAFIENVIFH